MGHQGVFPVGQRHVSCVMRAEEPWAVSVKAQLSHQLTCYEVLFPPATSRTAAAKHTYWKWSLHFQLWDRSGLTLLTWRMTRKHPDGGRGPCGLGWGGVHKPSPPRVFFFGPVSVSIFVSLPLPLSVSLTFVLSCISSFLLEKAFSKVQTAGSWGAGKHSDSLPQILENGHIGQGWPSARNINFFVDSFLHGINHFTNIYLMCPGTSSVRLER